MSKSSSSSESSSSSPSSNISTLPPELFVISNFLIKGESDRARKYLEENKILHNAHNIHRVIVAGDIPLLDLFIDVLGGVEKIHREILKFGATLLHSAARAGQNNIINHLVQKHKLDTKVQTTSLGTILHWAARGGHNSTIDCLIREYKMDPNDKDINKETILHCAARGGHESTLKHIRDQHHIEETRNSFGRTPTELLEDKKKAAAPVLAEVNSNSSTPTPVFNYPQSTHLTSSSSNSTTSSFIPLHPYTISLTDRLLGRVNSTTSSSSSNSSTPGFSTQTTHSSSFIETTLELNRIHSNVKEELDKSTKELSSLREKHNQLIQEKQRSEQYYQNSLRVLQAENSLLKQQIASMVLQKAQEVGTPSASSSAAISASESSNDDVVYRGANLLPMLAMAATTPSTVVTVKKEPAEENLGNSKKRPSGSDEGQGRFKKSNGR